LTKWYTNTVSENASKKGTTKMIKHIQILLNPDADTVKEMIPHYIVAMTVLAFVLFMTAVKIATGA